MFLEALIEPEIATTNRHMFLYGKNTPQRENTLKTIAEKYPFVIGNDVSSVIYIDDTSLPIIKPIFKNMDKHKINSMAMYYMKFTIIEAILNKVNLLTNIPDDFMQKVNDAFSYLSKKEYSSLDELIEAVKAGKKFWTEFFQYIFDYW